MSGLLERLDEHRRELRARVCGYYWLPCRNCGRMFGGFEEGGGTLWYAQRRGWVLCPRCPGDRYRPGVEPWRRNDDHVLFEVMGWQFRRYDDGGLSVSDSAGVNVVRMPERDAKRLLAVMGGNLDPGPLP